ncbi:MAG TPA: copper-containing nitrite reductase [Longimicrobiales bacterium]|nr:copper-containing nitrite reductase [Longimicrobiales bacterium]
MSSSKKIGRREALKIFGAGGVGLSGVVGGLVGVEGMAAADDVAGRPGTRGDTLPGRRPAQAVTLKRVAADPTKVPPPINGAAPRTRSFTLVGREAIAEIESGATFKYMTWNNQVPGPMLRVRQGDTVRLTVKSAEENKSAHNVDFHAVYGPGGGAADTLVGPGQQKTIQFRAEYPGAFIYHCAVPNIDEHISSGMFGMILVEPPEGLTPVDHEFYLGQNEVYTDQPRGTSGHHAFDIPSMIRETPSYVLLNGEDFALTPSNRGAIQVKRGETARIFFVNGGPNLLSSFHPIGNVWTKAWPAGALANPPLRYVQTLPVPPGSTGVFEMDFPVPEPIKLVDHAISRWIRQGMLGIIQVSGEEQPDIYKAIS